jgi:hypothetical protein
MSSRLATTQPSVEDEARLYPRAPAAIVPGAANVPALCVVLKYAFGEGAGAYVATNRVTLYADGTHEVDSAWIRQAAAPAPERADVSTVS